MCRVAGGDPRNMRRGTTSYYGGIKQSKQKVKIICLDQGTLWNYELCATSCMEI